MSRSWREPESRAMTEYRLGVQIVLGIIERHGGAAFHRHERWVHRAAAKRAKDMRRAALQEEREP